MNNKEKSLWVMCEREREFCHFLIFRSGWKWYRCEDGYQFSSQAIESLFLQVVCAVQKGAVTKLASKWSSHLSI